MRDFLNAFTGKVDSAATRSISMASNLCPDCLSFDVSGPDNYAI
jgi:hypothetical protein